MLYSECHRASNSFQDRCRTILRFLKSNWFIIIIVMSCETLPANDKKHLELVTGLILGIFALWKGPDFLRLMLAVWNLFQVGKKTQNRSWDCRSSHKKTLAYHSSLWLCYFKICIWILCFSNGSTLRPLGHLQCHLRGGSDLSPLGWHNLQRMAIMTTF